MYPDQLRLIYQYPSMTYTDLDQIVEKHEKMTFKKGDLLLREGQVSDCFYIVEKGIVRSYVYDYDGNDISTNFFCEDEIVIEVASIFHHIPTQENIICLTDCILWRIQFDAFQDLFEKIPAVTEWGRAWMSHQLFLTKKRALDMISLSALDRYQQLLETKPDTSLSRIRKELVGK
jgi:CRP-like cAMP-binding protein